MWYKLVPPPIVIILVLFFGWLDIEDAYTVHPEEQAVLRDVRAYLNAWVQRDFATMYDRLARETQRYITKPVFVRRFQAGTSRFVKVERVLWIHLDNLDYALIDSADQPRKIALVSYALDTQITAREALRLQKAGYKGAKPGERIAITRRRAFLLENGHWRMYLPLSHRRE